MLLNGAALQRSSRAAQQRGELSLSAPSPPPPQQQQRPPAMDAGTKATVQKMPTLTGKACPRDGDEWAERLKEELACLI